MNTKGPCPDCGSSDARHQYDDHYFCFACQTWSPPDGELMDSQEENKSNTSDFRVTGEVAALVSRGIREDTCKLFDYRRGVFHDRPCQFAYYFDQNRKPVAAKVRFPDKTFTVIGNAKKLPFYGQWLWNKGKYLIITEGEIDALSVSQVQGNKWPVVSVPQGAQGAKQTFKQQLDWLNGFETIVIMFDMDEPGQKAALECAELLPPGRAKIAQLAYKDPNECLQKDDPGAIIKAFWDAKVFRPDGIVDGTELWDLVKEADDIKSVAYPWDDLNHKTRGMRQGELITITAGSGVGKSALVREIAHHLIQRGETVGMIMLEESIKRTALGLMGLVLDKPLHISTKDVHEDELRRAYQASVGSGRCYLYDHFGSTEVEHLLGRVRYLSQSLDCRWIILDHLSIVVSGLEGEDERRLIDRAMTLLRTLVQETGIGLILVSHLRRPDGKGHEEGAQTSLSQLRGSHAIAQLSDIVLGLERNQQSEDAANELVVRVLKNRFTGETGEACKLFSSRETGRLSLMPAVDGGDNNEQMEF